MSPSSKIRPSPKRIAFIIASTRTPRVGPTVAKVATGVIIPRLPSHITLTVVDLMDYPLPLYTADPMIPNGLLPPISDTAYADARTNAWSALVRSFDAFIFCTPQYNWGYPATLKLALDALYHEWTGKPALVISYGIHGGGKAAGLLRQVLEGLHMRVCQRGVELGFGKEHNVGGGELGKDTNNRWRAEDKKEELLAAGKELLGLLNVDAAGAVY